MSDKLNWRGLELGWIEQPQPAFEHRGEQIYAHVRPRGHGWVARLTVEHIDSGVCVEPTPCAALDAAAEGLRDKFKALCERIPGVLGIGAAPVDRATTTGGMRIALERIRQIDQEGYSAEHDDMHKNGELVLAALCYASPLKLYVKSESNLGVRFDDVWPASWDKRPPQIDPGRKLGGWWQDMPLYDVSDSAERRLEKAGALIAAELDRLRRAREKGSRNG